jgi:hypothetical protein
MNIEAIARVVDTMSVENLRALNRLVVDRINGIHRASTALKAAAFRPGDTVQFTDSRHGRTVTMLVDRINTKSIGGREVTPGMPSTKWRVSPGLCRKVVKSGVGSAPLGSGAGTCEPHAPSAGIW